MWHWAEVMLCNAGISKSHVSFQAVEENFPEHKGYDLLQTSFPMIDRFSGEIVYVSSARS